LKGSQPSSTVEADGGDSAGDELTEAAPPMCRAYANVDYLGDPMAYVHHRACHWAAFEVGYDGHDMWRR
jgi:hypothetical protein